MIFCKPKAEEAKPTPEPTVERQVETIPPNLQYTYDRIELKRTGKSLDWTLVANVFSKEERANTNPRMISIMDNMRSSISLNKRDLLSLKKIIAEMTELED